MQVPKLYGFDGNDRGFPTLLTKRAQQAGMTEVTLRSEGPDEIRLVLPPGWHSHKLYEFTADTLVEHFHQGWCVAFEVWHQNGERLTVVCGLYNSGRAKGSHARADVYKSFQSFAQALRVHTVTPFRKADVVIAMLVEIGEGDDKKLYDEAELLKHAFPTRVWAHYGRSRERVCVLRDESLGRVWSNGLQVPGTSVHRQTPARAILRLFIVRIQLKVRVFHSPAGFHNGHRPKAIKRLLGVSWRRVLWAVRRDARRT